MFACSQCGTQNEIGSRFCLTCGQNFQYNCPACGSIVDPALATCPYCNSMLFWSVQRATHRANESVYQQHSEEIKRRPGIGSWFQKWIGLLLIMAAEIIVLLGFSGYFLIGKLRSLDLNQLSIYAQEILAHGNDVLNALQSLDTYQLLCLFAGFTGGLAFIAGLFLLIKAGRR